MIFIEVNFKNFTLSGNINISFNTYHQKAFLSSTSCFHVAFISPPFPFVFFSASSKISSKHSRYCELILDVICLISLDNSGERETSSFFLSLSTSFVSRRASAVRLHSLFFALFGLKNFQLHVEDFSTRFLPLLRRFFAILLSFQ